MSWSWRGLFASGGLWAALATVAAKLGLTAFGFTSTGVAAGSAAAAAQSGIGSVASGSAFALFQSIGAGGALLLPFLAMVALINVPLAAAFYLLFKLGSWPALGGAVKGGVLRLIWKSFCFVWRFFRFTRFAL